MILVQKVTILPSEAKKNGKIVSAKLLPLMATQTIPHLNVNVAVYFAQMFKIFDRKMANFPLLGMHRIPCIPMPYAYDTKW